MSDKKDFPELLAEFIKDCLADPERRAYLLYLLEQEGFNADQTEQPEQ